MSKRSTITHHFVLPIRTEETLCEYVRISQCLHIPDRQMCSTHSTPWRAYCDAYFSRHPVMIWKASRGLGGKSMLLASLAKVKAETQVSDVSILGGSGEQSKRVLDALSEFWKHENAPRSMLNGEVAREMRLTNGAKMTALMASSASARGAHPQFLAVDEVDECDIEIIDDALGQPMDDSRRPWASACTVMSSTHHRTDGAMTEILRRAGDRGWPVHEWCIEETREANGGWLKESQIDKTRATMTAAQWENEVLLQEPSPESRAIVPAAVKAMFRRDLGDFAGEPRQYIEVDVPVPTGVYVTGCDLARDRDWTIVLTFKISREDPKRPKAKLVAFERLGREPYPAMLARYEYQVKRFCSQTAYDATGLGTVVTDLLGFKAAGVTMTGRVRADLITNYIAAIERGDVVSPMIRHMEVEHRLASREIYQAGDEHLPDTIAAGALAWWCVSSFPKWSAS